MVSCASCGRSVCKKTQDNTLSFHRFPKEEKRRAAWIQFVKKTDFIPKSSSVLCSHHFNENCFDRTSKAMVRLLPNAVPSIEVDRLKYVRIFCAEEKRILEGIPSTSSIDVSSVSVSVSLPRVTIHEQTAEPSTGTSLIELEDTPHKRGLKRKIHQLESMIKLKSRKIRALQKTNWRQKRKISSLKGLTRDLKSKNLLTDEHENVMIEHFGANKDLIGRLLQKTQMDI